MVMYTCLFSSKTSFGLLVNIMSRSPGVFGRLWQGLRGTLGMREQAARFVGEDHLGNKYYEKDPDPKRSRRGSRWMEARDHVDGDMSFIPEVPNEWDAWLRKRRNNPPTQEELDRNYVTMIRTQQRAKELAMKESKEISEGDTGKETMPYTETISQDSYKSKFPKYEDFEVSPGQFREREEKRKDH